VCFTVDSLIAYRWICCFQTTVFAKPHGDYLNSPLCLDFSKATARNVTRLGIDKVIRSRHQWTVHQDTLCIELFVVICNVVALSSAALMISGKLIWLPCQNPKMFKSIMVSRSCWLSLKNFQTLHGQSLWRTKHAIMYSKTLRRHYFCTRTKGIRRGFGFNPPLWAWYFTKSLFPAQRKWMFSRNFACWLVDFANITE